MRTERTAETSKRATQTDWKKRFGAAKAPHIVTLPADFAGVKAGSTMLISSPQQIAAYIATIPAGERRTIARMRSDLARRAGADAMCPVTAAIFLRVVAETALSDLAAGRDLDAVTPFWRLLTPDDKLTRKLSCGTDGVLHLQALDAAGPPPAAA